MAKPSGLYTSFIFLQKKKKYKLIYWKGLYAILFSVFYVFL